MFLPFVRRVLDICVKTPDKIALINARTGEKASYADLYRHVAWACQRLTDMGVKTKSSVILAADRTFNFIFGYLAIHALGAVAVPLDPRAPVSHIKRIAHAVTPDLILWPDAGAPGSRDLGELSVQGDAPVEIASIQSDALADIMFTSGTTGDPKGVLLTHANLACAINNINAYIGNTADDTELCPMPLSHSFGIARIRCNLYSGGTIILEDGVANVRHLFGALAEYNATGLGMVGPAWLMLRKLSGDRLGRFKDQLRYFELGSAAIDARDKAHLASLLPGTRLCMHYGLTEASRAAFLDFHDDPARLESVGKASPYCEIAIFDSDGHKLDPGQMGEVCVRGDMVCQSYHDPLHNEGAWLDGFFRTGDSGWMDSDGYLYLEGRLKEMINVGGEKVAPLEVEKLLVTLPGVAEAACTGMPDPVLGERVAAFIVPKANEQPDFKSCREILKDRLEPFKIPAKFALINELPRTISGKIKRAALKELL